MKNSKAKLAHCKKKNYIQDSILQEVCALTKENSIYLGMAQKWEHKLTLRKKKRKKRILGREPKGR